MQLLNREPVYRQIYRLLEQRIIEKQLYLGDAIPTEHELANEFDVNRSSVREALRLLEENGLVARKPGGKKLLVSKPNRSRLGQRLSNSMMLESVTFRQLYQAIRVIEPEITAIAATSVSPDLLAALDENLRQTASKLDDLEALLALDFEFHRLVAASSQNKVLEFSRLGVVELFYPAVNRLLQSMSVGHRLLFAHQQIVSAMRAGDADRARLWSIKHTDDFKRGYEIAGLDLDAAVSP